MDVVFNHTAEGNEKGPILSFRSDNSVYYMLAPKYHDVVRQFIKGTYGFLVLLLSAYVEAPIYTRREEEDHGTVSLSYVYMMVFLWLI
ncbi:hypothetical protein LWI28_027704 [Acer negundo]|uniref:Uncharacterized protein n=1 Tax=Acer negundo TaxID=4023 RepID=A0AAD5J1N7_ACENE|nr:hypothetical protein LWI28_027704 [Acer negundo]